MSISIYYEPFVYISGLFMIFGLLDFAMHSIWDNGPVGMLAIKLFPLAFPSTTWIFSKTSTAWQCENIWFVLNLVVAAAAVGGGLSMWWWCYNSGVFKWYIEFYSKCNKVSFINISYTIIPVTGPIRMAPMLLLACACVCVFFSCSRVGYHNDVLVCPFAHRTGMDGSQGSYTLWTILNEAIWCL